MGLNRLLGDWRIESVEPVADLADGLHFMRARTIGLKGVLGGYHSYAAYVRGGVHTVFEVSDAETLDHQGVTLRSYIERPLTPKTQVVLASDRHGYQRWFGAAPKVLATCNVPLIEVLTIVSEYPQASMKFHVLRNNCNTFVSWLAYNVGCKLPWTWGMRSHRYWARREK
jgi:hypothetical protein